MAGLPLVHWLSVALTFHVDGSVVPSCQKRAFIWVPWASIRTHHFVPAAPEASNVPLPSDCVPAPPALTTRCNDHFTAPAVVCVITAEYPFRASAWARATTRA